MFFGKFRVCTKWMFSCLNCNIGSSSRRVIFITTADFYSAKWKHKSYAELNPADRFMFHTGNKPKRSFVGERALHYCVKSMERNSTLVFISNIKPVKVASTIRNPVSWFYYKLWSFCCCWFFVCLFVCLFVCFIANTCLLMIK